MQCMNATMKTLSFTFLTNLQPTVYDERRNKRKGEAISEKETW